jgi:hypothetical protein
LQNESLYFTDNFFSAGRTEIFNETKEKVGELDLKSAFSSSIDVLDKNGEITITGKFPFFSNKWLITDRDLNELGDLRAKFSFFSRKYQYTAYDRGIYLIEAEAFSHKYEIYDDQLNKVGNFEKVSGFFSSPAFKLTNYSDQVTALELIAVVMGVHNIQKRNSSNAAT